MRRRLLTRLAIAAVLLLAIALPVAGISGMGPERSTASWTISTSNPANSVLAHTLGNPGSVNGTKFTGAATTCTNVTVTWTAAAAPVNSYKVEAKTANGSWTVLNADTGNVVTISDLTLYTQQEVTYRVTGLYKFGGSLTPWLSTGATDATPLVCGSVGEVDDLLVVQRCNSPLTWSAAPLATSYDIQSRVNGGAWGTGGINLVNQAVASYTDTTSYAAGANIEWQIRPGIGAGNDGQWSNITGVNPWGCEVTDLAVVHSCDAVLTWTAPLTATRYDIRRQVDGAGWTTVSTNLNALTYTDTASNTAGGVVEYQIRPGIGTTNDGAWSPSQTIPSWGCEISNLAVTANCASGALTWSVPGNATTYDRRVRTNGGAWTTTLNVAGNSWTDAVAKTPVAGGVVEYQVRGGIGTNFSDGKWSNVATIADWGFYIKTITFGASDGSLVSGDTITVVFNRDASTAVGTGGNANSAYTRITGTKGITIGGNANGAAAGSIGFLVSTANISPANAAISGTSTWVDPTTWRWVSSNATVASTLTPGFTTFTVGSSAQRVKCSDTTTNVMALAPTISGTF